MEVSLTPIAGSGQDDHRETVRVSASPPAFVYNSFCWRVCTK